MITKLTKKNKYGGYTWKFEISIEFHINIHETNDTTFIVELKEAGYFKYKTCFTYISNDSMISTIRKAFETTFKYFVETKRIYWEELVDKKFEAIDKFNEIESKI